MALDSFLAGSVAAAERLRAATPDYQEWSDDRLVLRWRGDATGIAVDDDRVVLATGVPDPYAPGADAAAVAIRELHARHGARFLDRVAWFASGVVYDRRTGSLAAFRDLPGGGSAVVADGADGVLAASDVETLLPALAAPRPEPVWVASVLQNQLLDARASAYAGVRYVSPGALARRGTAGWSEESVARWHRQPAAGLRTDEEYAEHLAGLLKAAIRRQVAGVQRAGVMLSGGQDSSLLLALAVEAAPEISWQAFCIPFYSARGDERERQQAVADHVGVPVTWVDVTGRSPLGVAGGPLFGGRAGPPMIGNWFFGVAVAQAAAAAGVEVVLDGEDADSLLWGDMSYLADLLLSGRLRTLRRECVRWERFGIRRRTALRDAVHTAAPPWLRPALGDHGPQPQVSDVLAPALAAETDVARRQVAARVLPWRPWRQFSVARAAAVRADVLGLLLREMTASWRDEPVRLGHPYADRAVIEFCLRLPWHVVCGDVPKRAIRLAARPRLPGWFVDRPSKADLSEYWDTAIFEADRDRVEAGLAGVERRTEYVDPAGVARIRAKWADRAEGWTAGRVAALGLWLDELAPPNG